MMLAKLILSAFFFGAALAQYDCRFDTEYPRQQPGECRNYYVCYQGDRLEYLCRKNQLFNSYTKQCAPSSDVTCLPTKEPVGEKCALDAPTTFQADPESCSHYTSCIDGLKYRMKCSDGLVFNQNIGACDLVENVKCVGKVTHSSVPPDGESNEALCPSSGEGPKEFQPHPESCSKYYNCIAGLYYEYSCPINTHFNSETRSCDTESGADCTINTPHPDCPDGAPAHPQAEPDNCAGFFICYNGTKLNFTCHEDHIFNNETMLCDIESPGSVCPIKDRCEGLPDYTKLPHDTDCDKYYKCIDCVSHEISCPPGLHFSADRVRCEKPEHAKCTLDDTTTTDDVTTTTSEDIITEEITTTTEEITTTTETTICTGVPDYEKLPHEVDCSSYYMCIDNVPVSSKCPTPFVFNPNAQICAKAEHSECKTVLCDDFAKFPDSVSCNKYFQCMGNTLLEATCPDPLHYNVRKGMCDYKHVAGCTPK